MASLATRIRWAVKLKRMVAFAIAAAMLVTLVAACGQQSGGASQPSTSASSSTAAKKPFKWGFMTPLTGRSAGWGLPQKAIVEVAVEDINKQGGANGYPVEVIYEDSPFDPKQAVTLSRKLIEQDKVPVIFGPFSSGEYEVAAPIGNQMKVVMVTTAAIKIGLHKNNQPYGIGFRATDDMAADRNMKNFKKQWPNVKKVAITYDDKESVAKNTGTAVWPAAAKANGFEVIDSVPFQTGQQDLSAQVTRIKNSGAEAVFISSLNAEAVVFAREYTRQKVGLPVMGSSTMATGDFLTGVGKDAEGWLIEDLFSWQENPDATVQSVVTRATEKIKQSMPGAPPTIQTSAAGMYDALLVTRDVFNKMKITPDMPIEKQRELAKDGWQQVKTYDGILGHYEMAEDGADIVKGLAWVKGGKFVAAK